MQCPSVLVLEEEGNPGAEPWWLCAFVRESLTAAFAKRSIVPVPPRVSPPREIRPCLPHGKGPRTKTQRHKDNAIPCIAVVSRRKTSFIRDEKFRCGVSRKFGRKAACLDDAWVMRESVRRLGDKVHHTNPEKTNPP
jgi:hypothetical protein